MTDAAPAEEPLAGTNEDRYVSPEFRELNDVRQGPICDTCRGPAVWSDAHGWLHATDRHPHGLPRAMDRRRHDVTVESPAIETT